MKIARLACLALIAIFAMSLVVASAAAALPEFKPSTKASLTTKSITSGGTLKAAGNTVTCKEETSTGEITGPMEVSNILIHFTGCESFVTESTKCAVNSKGATVGSGLLLTATLHGVLGLVLPGDLPGLLLLPNSGSVFLTFEKNACTIETKVTGSVAGLIEPFGKGSTKTGKLVFSAPGGKQEIKDIDTLSGLVAPELVAFSETATQEINSETKDGTGVEVT